MRSIVEVMDHPDLGKVQVVALKDDKYRSLGANVEPFGGGAVLAHYSTIFQARDALGKQIAHPEGKSKPESFHAAIQAASSHGGTKR